MSRPRCYDQCVEGDVFVNPDTYGHDVFVLLEGDDMTWTIVNLTNGRVKRNHLWLTMTIPKEYFIYRGGRLL